MALNDPCESAVTADPVLFVRFRTTTEAPTGTRPTTGTVVVAIFAARDGARITIRGFVVT